MTDNSGVGLSNQNLSRSRRQLLDLINRLHSTGAQVDIDLPQIAVIGSQSAGKSSLIESISGITLPRASGTCTRCPTECRLTHSEKAWKCTVVLRTINDKHGRPLGQAINKQFGDIITDKSKVEERIRRAQRAILNPSKEFNAFLEGADEDPADFELTFSTNCVSLSISGPDVADLSFCDLPGLIASVGASGKESDIALVKGLVTSYIEKESCIILLTVACETDFENQGAHHLAKTFDPDGKRTIGVLTKPDRIPVGEEESWLPFIRNEKEPLENNWYCVKQPSQADLKKGVTWSDARKREDEWFALTQPWSSMDFVYQRYLRTTNLIERLSSILSDLVKKRLPEIQTELAKSLQSASASLSRLPKPPSNNPQHDIATKLSDFCSELRRRIEGVPDKKGIIQSIRPFQVSFRRAIRETAPNFIPVERARAVDEVLAPFHFLENEEEADDDSTTNDDESEDEDVDEPQLTFTDDVPEDEDYNDQDSETEKADDEYSDDAIYIDEVNSRALHARTRELPGNHPFIVQASFIRKFVQNWLKPAKELCDAVHGILVEHVDSLISETFGGVGTGVLEHQVRTIIMQHLGERLEQTKERVAWLHSIEDLPFTLNTHYLSDYQTKFMAAYKGHRQQAIHGDLLALLNRALDGNGEDDEDGEETDASVQTILSELVKLGIRKVDPVDLFKLLPADEMEPALRVMSEVRAYFQVAYKRYTDTVPLAIDRDLVRGIQTDLLAILADKLGVYGPEGHDICSDLAAESSQINAKRLELNMKMKRLQSASQELASIHIPKRKRKASISEGTPVSKRLHSRN